MLTATVSVAVSDFALSHALGEVAPMDVEAERVATHSRRRVMPSLWARGGDFAEFDAALDADPTVAEVVTAATVGDERFYQVAWSDEVAALVDSWLDADGSMLRARTSDREWRLRVRFPDREQFDRFRSSLSARDVSFQLDDLTRSTGPRQQLGSVTAAQREALVTAVEAGYFDVPRDATMAEIADALDISSQAASERLRRGIDGFVRSTLLASDGPDAD